MRVQLSDCSVGILEVSSSGRYVLDINSAHAGIQMQLLLHPDQVLALSDLLRQALRPQLPFD